MQATSQDKEMASLLGIPVALMIMEGGKDSGLCLIRHKPDHVG
jgi:hypothetical protein